MEVSHNVMAGLVLKNYLIETCCPGLASNYPGIRQLQ